MRTGRLPRSPSSRSCCPSEMLNVFTFSSSRLARPRGVPMLFFFLFFLKKNKNKNSKWPCSSSSSVGRVWRGAGPLEHFFSCFFFFVHSIHRMKASTRHRSIGSFTLFLFIFLFGGCFFCCIWCRFSLFFGAGGAT